MREYFLALRLVETCLPKMSKCSIGVEPVESEQVHFSVFRRPNDEDSFCFRCTIIFSKCIKLSGVL